MILEGKKLTAFDAMEAAIELSQMYLIRGLHRVVNFRFSQALEAIVFEFGIWEGFEYSVTDDYTVYLNNAKHGGDSFSKVFNKIEEEMILCERGETE